MTPEQAHDVLLRVTGCHPAKHPATAGPCAPVSVSAWDRWDAALRAALGVDATWDLHGRVPYHFLMDPNTGRLVENPSLIEAEYDQDGRLAGWRFRDQGN